jgi:hypothetical protein
MLYRQSVEPNKIAEIYKQAKYIKILNCANEMQMRVFSRGSIIQDTEVRAGFELELQQTFEKVVFASDYTQDIEVWVDNNRLRYDAISNGSNFNNTVLYKHYGDVEQLVPFEPNRISATIYSDTDTVFYGGEGVTVESGLPIPAGTEKTISGAGAIYLAINKPASYKVDKKQMILNVPWGCSTVLQHPQGVIMSGDGAEPKMVVYRDGQLSEPLFYGSTDNFNNACYVDDDTIMATAWYGNYSYFFNLKTGEKWTTYFGVGSSFSRDSVFFDGKAYAATGANSDNYLLDSQGNKVLRCTNNSGAINRVYATRDNYLLVFNTHALYQFDVNAIPAVVDYDALTPIWSHATGSSLARFSENDNYILISLPGSNTKSLLITKADRSIREIPCEAATLTKDGVVYLTNGYINEYDILKDTSTNYIINDETSNSDKYHILFYRGKFLKVNLYENIMDVFTTNKKRDKPVSQIRLMKAMA